MDVGVAIALIAAAGSIAGVLATNSSAKARDGRAQQASQLVAKRQGEMQVELTRLSHDLEGKARQEERVASAKAELDRVREPLLLAALDLAHRLDNIREDHFLDGYLTSDDPHRRKIVRTSTLYRLARYWCVVESLSDRIAVHRFQEDETTRPVGGTLRSIGKAFATDAYGQQFMMWREEQRAIAELMRDDGTPFGCIGFATFSERYETSFAQWFESFNEALEPDSARASERFRVLQHLLATLVSQLDDNKSYQDQWSRLL